MSDTTHLWFCQLVTPDPGKVFLVIEAASCDEALSRAQLFAINANAMQPDDPDQPDSPRFFRRPTKIDPCAGTLGIRMLEV